MKSVNLLAAHGVQGSILEAGRELKTVRPMLQLEKKQARGNPNMFKHGGQRAEPSEVP